jgi:hypothetical protein
MKIIKMKIQRLDIGGGTRYVYPKPYYEPKKVIFGPVYEAGAKERGMNYEYIIFGVRDADVSGFLAANSQVSGGFTFEVQEIDRNTAIADADPWAPQTERIIDQTKILAICAKAVRGEVLTQQEKDALDPNKTEIGINKTPSFTERLDDALGKF